MRICVTADGPDLESDVSKDIGHSPYFLVVNPDTMEFEAFENEAVDRSMDAGMRAADIIIRLEVSAVITGGIDLHESQRLARAGIGVISGEEGSVMDAVSSFRLHHMHNQ